MKKENLISDSFACSISLKLDIYLVQQKRYLLGKQKTTYECSYFVMCKMATINLERVFKEPFKCPIYRCKSNFQNKNVIKFFVHKCYMKLSMVNK